MGRIGNTPRAFSRTRIASSACAIRSESGKQNVQRTVNVKMVSTASVGFTDGAYREYTKGVFADQNCFIRVRDPIGIRQAECPAHRQRENGLDRIRRLH